MVVSALTAACESSTRPACQGWTDNIGAFAARGITIVCSPKPGERLMKRCLICSLALLVAIPWPARADSYYPFTNFRKADPTLRFYIVVKKLPDSPEDPNLGTSVAFEIAECRKNAAPITEAEDQIDPEDYDRTLPNPEVKIREGDLRLGTGRLQDCPRRFLISSSGLGFVGLDVRAFNKGSFPDGAGVVVVTLQGEIRHRIRIVDLFTQDEFNEFPRTAGTVWWLDGGWIDEQRSQVVIVTSGPDDKETAPRLIRIVNLKTGQVSSGSMKDVLAALAEQNVAAADFALDLVAKMRFAEAKALLPALIDNAALPMGSRLRAAVTLATFHEVRGAELMARSAVEKGPAQEYALEHLWRLMGDRAGRVICDAVRHHGDDIIVAAWEGMSKVHVSTALPLLIERINDRTCPAGMDFAATAIGVYRRDARAAVPHLIRLIEDEPRTKDPQWTRTRAVRSLANIGKDANEALPLIKRLAAKSSLKLQEIKARRPSENSESYDIELHDAQRFHDALYEARVVIE